MRWSDAVASPQPPGSLTLIALLKDEAPYLLEWLAFHRAVGVRDFVIYEDGSRDGSPALLRRLAAADVLRWVDWHGRALHPQIDAYNEALLFGRIATDWAAFIDLDEFLVPKGGRSLPQLLSALPAEATAILANWVVFGSGGHAAYAPGLVTDRFRLRLPLEALDSYLTKVIARPAAVAFAEVHRALLHHGRALDGNGRELRRGQNCRFTEGHCGELLQLNHYLLKSRAEFAAKLERGSPSYPWPPGRPPFRRSWADFEQVDGKARTEDRAIDPWRPALLQELAWLQRQVAPRWRLPRLRAGRRGRPETVSAALRERLASPAKQAWQRVIAVETDPPAARRAAKPYLLV